MIRLVVLISGGGSNLQSILDGIERGEIEAKISVVISNCADAFGLERARRAGVKTEVVDHLLYSDRQAYDQALGDVVSRFMPDLIVLAGFMRILGKNFVKRFHGKIMNIHPSLLPRHRGLNTHQRALESGDEFHGATVHFVTAELDDGPVIIQAKVRVADADSPESLQKRVLKKEHLIYPKAIQAFAKNNISFNKPALENEISTNEF